ncbi:hypothetical protein EVAR_29780_1 [Eumeta japonica]|uniref:Uncharacterized protein n=1 Tax=Eumeta variegata TaxID=151549 RepID=A0A4C1WU39_EUMVA|nr:hypothetical protein EVAR_29780_1 [Eumeta japonica]
MFIRAQEIVSFSERLQRHVYANYFHLQPLARWRHYCANSPASGSTRRENSLKVVAFRSLKAFRESHWKNVRSLHMKISYFDNTFVFDGVHPTKKKLNK